MPDFTGEFGGMIAGATITGFVLGWRACMTIVVKPIQESVQKHEDRIKKLEAKFLDLE